MRRGHVGVVLQLRDFGLVHQRLHARQVGLGAIVVGLLGGDVGLRERQVGAVGLLVGDAGALHFGFGVGQLRGGHGIAATRVVSATHGTVTRAACQLVFGLHARAALAISTAAW